MAGANELLTAVTHFQVSGTATIAVACAVVNKEK